MEWHLARNGSRWGPYPEAQLMQMAADGQLAASDQLWAEGMEGWRPVSEMREMFPHETRFIPAGGDDASLRWILPVGRSGWAIAAGYLGLVAVLFFPAPFALFVGVIAIFDVRAHPDRHGMGRAIFGTAMGAVFTALLLALVIANP